MSSRIPEPCDATSGEHEGPVRFFITGWKCRAHAPRPRAVDPPESGVKTTT